MSKSLLLLSFFIGVLYVFVFHVDAQAQESGENLNESFEISYPIAELGNCASVEVCKDYCDDVTHHEVCINFAKTKGLYVEEESQQIEDLIKSARAELGCRNYAACESFCSEPSNQSKCMDFAMRHGLGSYQPASYESASDAEIMNYARQELGCQTYEECMAFCNQEANWDHCSSFAEKHGLGQQASQMKEMMTRAKASLGCDSPTACMKLCSEPQNQLRCMEVFKEFGGTEANYEGEPPEVWCPKAARAEGEICTWDGNVCSCWNPDECTKWSGCSWTGSSCECTGQSYSEQDPDVWCSQAGPYCKWDGSSCNCSEPGEVWCPKQSACHWDGTQCNCTSQTTTESPEVWCPKAGPNCSWDGSQCNCFDPSECTKYPGCTWTGANCDCSQQQTTGSSEAVCVKETGCTWHGTYCSCPSGESAPTTQEIYDPNIESHCVAAGCSWTGSGCDCSGSSSQVQGASTTPTFLQVIWSYLTDLF